MQRWVLFFVLCVSMAGCAAEEPVGGARQPVIGGSVETDHREVVAVVRTGVTGSAGLCSGTVIGDYAVLTAKHCVYDEVSSGVWNPVPRSEFLVAVATDVNSSSGIEERTGIYEIRTTPGDDVDGDLESGDDIAILLLPAPLDVTPRQHATSNPSRGESITLVGFGRTSDADDSAGVKHRGSTSVDDVGTNLIRTRSGFGDAGTCQGDSGGPALDSSGRVAGITSFGFGGCSLGNSSFFTNVAKHRAMIEDALTFEPPCEETGAETCDGVDNDCDGTIDEGCTALGEPCGTDAECSNGYCDTVDGSDVCVRECDPRFQIPQCPVGYYCEALGCGMGRCLRGREGTKGAGEECADDSECKSLNCTNVAGAMRCARQCTTGEGDPCAEGLLCEDTGDGCGACIPLDLSSGPRPFGAPCETDDQCESMDCADGGFCTGPCSESSPCPSDDYHCREGTCVAGAPGGLGDPCIVDDDCGDMAPECVETEGESLCVAPCDGGECLLDFECRPTEVGERCVPPGKPLGEMCAEHAECRSGICAGTCTQLCDSTPCPEGFVCQMAGEHSGCFPAPEGGGGGGGGGGCAAANGAGAGGGVIALLLIAVLSGRFRRRR